MYTMESRNRKRLRSNSIEQSHTITILHENETYTYTYKSMCNDDKLIEQMKGQDLIDPELRVNELSCPAEDYVAGEEVGGSSSNNNIYSIHGMSDKVLRITKKTAPSTSPHHFFGVLAGYFVQAYLSSKCPNICKVYDFGLCYITLNGVEYIKAYSILERLSEDLFDQLEVSNHGTYPFNHTTWISYISDILEALKCMNQHRYAHLDIKPENMAFNSSHKLCLFDFDTVRYFPVIDKKQQYVYVSDKLIGTPEYLAPEILNEYKKRKTTKPKCKYSVFADIYALGLLLDGTKYYINDYKNHSTFYEFFVNKLKGDLYLHFNPNVSSEKLFLTDIEPNSNGHNGYYHLPLVGRPHAGQALKYIKEYQLTTKGGKRFKRTNLSRKPKPQNRKTKKNLH